MASSNTILLCEANKRRFISTTTQCQNANVVCRCYMDSAVESENRYHVGRCDNT
jgi:hypothetical protein